MNTFLDICEELPVETYEPGEAIVQESQKDPRLFILRSGSVEILKENLQINVVSSAGSMIGEISLLLDRPHMATVRALESTECYVAEDGLSALRSYPDLNLHISRILAARLHAVINYVVDVKTEYEPDPMQRQMVEDLLENIIFQQDQEGHS